MLAASRQRPIVAAAPADAPSRRACSSSACRRRSHSLCRSPPPIARPLVLRQPTTTSTSTSTPASAASAASASAALASTTFSAATVAAVCAYAALVTRPRSRLALFLTSSPLLPLTGCLAYLLAVLTFWPGPVSQAAGAAVAASTPLPTVDAFASLFAAASRPGAAAMTWLHLIAGDFAAAAWVARDARRLGSGGDGGAAAAALFASSDDDDGDEGEEKSPSRRFFFSFLRPKRPRHFPCAVSIVLCFMAGPLGILSHLLTRRLWYRMGWGIERQEEEEGEGAGASVAAAAATPLSTF